MKNYFKRLKNFLRKYFELSKLFFLKKMEFDKSNLSKKIDVQKILNDENVHNLFFENKNILSKIDIPSLSGGVNIGDQRTIYYLLSSLKPKSILEIGTHLGSSTISIALATKNYSTNAMIDTVDIHDVNDPKKEFWKKFGSKNSAKNNLKTIKLDHIVTFHISNSISFLKSSIKKYDFIFLDGSHSADYVYQEIMLSLKKLNNDGVILLHDYFHEGKEIWEGKLPIYGPYIAVKKILKENKKICIDPLIEVPWHTKLSTNKSSLAVLYKQ